MLAVTKPNLFFAISSDAACLADAPAYKDFHGTLGINDLSLPKTKPSRIQTLPTIKRTIRSNWGESVRDFALVETVHGMVYADKITGTIYHRHTGECFSSVFMRMLPR